MTYRVIIDFGPVEITVMHWSDTPDTEKIYQGSLGFLETEGFTYLSVTPQ